MIQLSLKYIRFYKQQSLYVILGLIATVAVLTAINSAFRTNNQMELERAREVYGDYHYEYGKLVEKDIEKASSLQAECKIEKLGWQRIGKRYGGKDNAAAIRLKSMDTGLQDLLGMKLIEGRYPLKSGEIALEEWVLSCFTEDGMGAQIDLDGDIKKLQADFSDKFGHNDTKLFNRDLLYQMNYREFNVEEYE